MLEILRFIFSSFWVFLGTLILLPIFVRGIVAIIGMVIVAIRGEGNINIR